MAEVDMEAPAKRMCEAPGWGNPSPVEEGSEGVGETRFWSDKFAAINVPEKLERLGSSQTLFLSSQT
jgi:hypothetical protein